jgi:O-acetyl-ADP-ribose deacetylase (regulator of RNase III)
MPFSIIRQDITKMRVDAIVNAANTALQMGGGVCGAIFKTAGPVYSYGKHGEEELLRFCYTNSLKRALENGCNSVDFPLISSGIYGYPKVEALRVATA